MTLRTEHDVVASQLTTLAVGGVCATVITASTSDDIVRALSENPTAICIGGGSNLLVSDIGMRAPIIRCFSSDIDELNIQRSGAVHVGAAVEWDTLVRRTVDAGLAGLECMSGIPGSTGGAIVQNAGAYGQEICERIVSLTVYDRREAQVQTIEASQAQFGYRTSKFKHDADRRYIVLHCELTLDVSDDNTPRYGDVHALLIERFGESDRYPLSAIREAVLEVRTAKGMVLGASAPSAGSFFTNPEIERETFDEIASHPGVKELVRNGDRVRVSAAALINGAGFEKGERHGNVGLSPSHVLALVNNGDATTQEVVDFANAIRRRVFDNYGVELVPEPVTLGFDEEPFPALR